MARNVRLSNPVDAERLAKVTGSAPPPPPAAAKPASPASGVRQTGQPLMPPGKLVQDRRRNMNFEEAQIADAIGFEGTQLPATTGDILAQALQERAAETLDLPMPVPANYQPPPLTIKNVQDLTPEEKARVKQQLEQAVEFQKAQEQVRAQTAASIPGNAHPSIAAAIQMADSAIIDDRPAPQAAPQPAPPAAPAAAPTRPAAPATPPPPTAAPTPVDAGAEAHLENCPHCRRRLSDPAMPEPSRAEKMAFLHSFLGEIPYTKEYPLFGGEVIVLFRTLTMAELDSIIDHAHKQVASGKLSSEELGWAKVNRLRTIAQLVSVRSTKLNTLQCELPEGLSKQTNPNAGSHYESESGETDLDAIEAHVMRNVLKTETMFRVVNQAVNEFNRLVAYMEAMVDNSDFWQPTKEPS